MAEKHDVNRHCFERTGGRSSNPDRSQRPAAHLERASGASGALEFTDVFVSLVQYFGVRLATTLERARSTRVTLCLTPSFDWSLHVLVSRWIFGATRYRYFRPLVKECELYGSAEKPDSVTQLFHRHRQVNEGCALSHVILLVISLGSDDDAPDRAGSTTVSSHPSPVPLAPRIPTKFRCDSIKADHDGSCTGYPRGQKRMATLTDDVSVPSTIIAVFLLLISAKFWATGYVQIPRNMKVRFFGVWGHRMDISNVAKHKLIA